MARRRLRVEEDVEVGREANLDITIWRCTGLNFLRYRHTGKYRYSTPKNGPASVTNRYRPNIVTSRIVISRFFCIGKRVNALEYNRTLQ